MTWLIRLHQILSHRFSDSELRTLCTYLGVRFGNLPAQDHSGKARELIEEMFRQRRLGELIETGRFMRPDINWSEARPYTEPGYSEESSLNATVINSQIVEVETRLEDNTLLQPADVVILTTLDEESQAIRRRIADLLPVEATHETPNIYGWEMGEITWTKTSLSYRILLAQIAGAGNLMSLPTSLLTILQWKPRYLFLVGIAGGLNLDGLGLGDVVISDHIYGYEYGKILEKTAEFEPRPDYTFRCDIGLINGTRRFVQRNPDWGNTISLPRPDQVTKIPKTYWGPVASGEKVIDEADVGYFLSVLSKSPKLLAVEMEGVGASAAVDQARALGYNCGFVMIRGISDMPSSQSGVDSGGKKRDEWKGYAAAASAAFAVEYIASGLPLPPAPAV